MQLLYLFKLEQYEIQYFKIKIFNLIHFNNIRDYMSWNFIGFKLENSWFVNRRDKYLLSYDKCI